VEGGGGGLTVSGVSRNRGGFVKCVAIQKRLGIPGLDRPTEILYEFLITMRAVCSAHLILFHFIALIFGRDY
jgi:hypothetical protein